MKNRSIVFAFAAVFALGLYSCKDKTAFTISGTIENAGKTNKVYLIGMDSSRASLIDSTAIDGEGKFAFKHAAPYADIYKLRIGGSIFDLIAQNGDQIGFKTNLSDSTHAFEVSGSDDSEKMKEFNKISNIYTEKNTKLYNEYQAKAEQIGKESDSLNTAYMPLFQKNVTDYGNEVLKFAQDNKKSLAGFYAVISVDPMKYEPQLIAYADDIKDKFKGNVSVEMFVKQMMAIKPVSVGQKAPDFTVNGLDSKLVKLSDYKGKYVMIDFWASWCVPCRQENPNVVKLYNAYKDKGLNILGISLDTEKADWQKAIYDDKLTWKHASDLQRFDGLVEKTYHIEAIPSNFIVDPQGVIIAKNITGADLAEFFKKTFNKS
jgi:peroxiredoxin